MTFGSAFQALVFAIAAITVAVIYNWPRRPDGSLMSVTEVERFIAIRSVREPPRRDELALWSAIFVSIIAVTYALSPHVF